MYNLKATSHINDAIIENNLQLNIMVSYVDMICLFNSVAIL